MYWRERERERELNKTKQYRMGVMENKHIKFQAMHVLFTDQFYYDVFFSYYFLNRNEKIGN